MGGMRKGWCRWILGLPRVAEEEEEEEEEEGSTPTS
jgi:hypothetical protein